VSSAPLTDVKGYVATDTTNKLTIIGFQGTESAKQAVVDVTFALKDVPELCKGCQAHSGFWQSWMEAQPFVMMALSTAPANHKLIVTGHSLGGAIATLAAGHIRAMGKAVDLYSFGAPRVGNQKLADFIQVPGFFSGQNHRVTHYNDPVPRLPPASFGYAHYVPEIYIKSASEVAVKINDVMNLDASNTATSGNEQFLIVDARAHSWYFNAISACYAANTGENAKKDAPANGLADNWAGAMLQQMGNQSGMVLIGTRVANNLAASTLAGMLATMSADAAQKLLDMIPGGDKIKPYLWTPTEAGKITAASVSAVAWVIQMVLDATMVSTAVFGPNDGSGSAAKGAAKTTTTGGGAKGMFGGRWMLDVER